MKSGREIAEQYNLAGPVQFDPEHVAVGTFVVAGGGSLLRVERWMPGLQANDTDPEPMMFAQCSKWPAGTDTTWEPEDIEQKNGFFVKSPRSMNVVATDLKDPDGMVWVWAPNNVVEEEQVMEEPKGIDLSALGIPVQEEEEVVEMPDPDAFLDTVEPTIVQPMTDEDFAKLGITPDGEIIEPVVEILPADVKYSGPPKSNKGKTKLYGLVYAEPSQSVELDVLVGQARVAGVIKGDEGEDKVLSLITELREKAGYDIHVTEDTVHIGPYEAETPAIIYVPEKDSTIGFCLQTPENSIVGCKNLRAATLSLWEELADLLDKHGINNWFLTYEDGCFRGELKSNEDGW